MLTFFRRIRRDFFGSGKARKYVLYAIGETGLVVLGILIALQVNNWNEERKQRQVEKKYFHNLKNDLHADNKRLDQIVDLANAKVKTAKIVRVKSAKDSIGSLYDFSGDMLTLIFTDDFRPNENTYEEMKSSGNFSTIRNDTLKLKLMNLRKTYTEIQAAQEHMRNDYDMFIEDFEKYIDWGKYYDLNKSDIPALNLVYDSVYIETHRDRMAAEVRELFNNKIFLNNIFLLEINYTYHIGVLEKTKAKIREIIGILDQELEVGQ